MADKTLSNPSLVVNNDTIAYKPNSISYKKGLGEKDVKAQTAGGKSVSVVVVVNAETMISECKFKLENTATNINYVETWANSLANGIELSEGEITVSFTDMVLVTDPEFSLGADGELELEFKGAPVL